MTQQRRRNRMKRDTANPAYNDLILVAGIIMFEVSDNSGSINHILVNVNTRRWILSSDAAAVSEIVGEYFAAGFGSPHDTNYWVSLSDEQYRKISNLKKEDITKLGKPADLLSKILEDLDARPSVPDVHMREADAGYSARVATPAFPDEMNHFAAVAPGMSYSAPPVMMPFMLPPGYPYPMTPFPVYGNIVPSMPVPYQYSVVSHAVPPYQYPVVSHAAPQMVTASSLPDVEPDPLSLGRGLELRVQERSDRAANKRKRNRVSVAAVHEEASVEDAAVAAPPVEDVTSTWRSSISPRSDGSLTFNLTARNPDPQSSAVAHPRLGLLGSNISTRT